MGDGVGRQLAGLAHRDHAHTEFKGERTGEQEAAGLDRRDRRDPCRPPRLGEGQDRRGEGAGVGEQGCDVTEQDARLGKVGDRADVTGEIHAKSVVRQAP
jgi:hypothetical protein